MYKFCSKTNNNKYYLPIVTKLFGDGATSPSSNITMFVSLVPLSETNNKIK